MNAVAALLAMATVLLLVPRSVRGPAESPTRASQVSPALLVPGLTTAGAALWLWLDARQLVLVLLLGCLAAGILRLVRRRRAVRAGERRAGEVLAFCDALASDLVAGQPPLTSLERAAAEWPELAPVAVAGRLGADVPGVLRELATRPGAGQLRTVAATWQVSQDTGAGLAVAVRRAASIIRAERRTARLVSSELAAAHATARMLAVLPVGVLLLGAGVGGDPVGFLTGSTPGLVCLTLGLALGFGGMLWLERIAERVQRR